MASSDSSRCCSRLSLNHEQPPLFRVSQWGDLDTVTAPYLVYRVLAALFFTVTYLYLWAVDVTYSTLWLIYLTNQSMLALVLHLLLDMSLAIVVFIDQHSGRHLSRQRMGVLEKTSWLLANVTSSICLMVSIFFWTILKNKKFLDYCRSVVCDLAVTGRPVVLSHLVYPVMFGLWYVAFSIAYWALGGVDPAGHHWIYPMLDWDKPEMAAITVLACAVGLVIIHCVLWAAVTLRTKIYSALWKNNNSQNNSTTNEEC